MNWWSRAGTSAFMPYAINGQQRNYIPDFIAHMDDGHGKDDPLKLVIEVTGQKDKDKEAKVATATTLWVPAVNNAAVWGRWAYVEVRDPWSARVELAKIAGLKGDALPCR